MQPACLPSLLCIRVLPVPCLMSPGCLQSWDMFEQMQQPTPPQPTGTHSASPPIIEPGSQPLPPGPPLQTTAGLRGLPPSGRRPSWPSPEGNPLQRVSGGSGLQGGSPLQRVSGGSQSGYPPQPTAVSVPAAAARPVVVDGVGDDLLNRWFAEADEDLDGRYVF